MNPGEIVVSGGLFLALPIALAAGLFSFLSPCVLPLVPGYLGYVSGFSLSAKRNKSKEILGSLLFVAGFSVIFLLTFVLAGTAGRFLLQYGELMLRVGGVVVILLGFVFLGTHPTLQKSFSFSWRPSAGLASTPIIGMLFALGWTPCISPTLTAIGFLAGYGGDPARASLIGLAYCAGLGVPFVLAAWGFSGLSRSLTWVRAHIRVVNIAGGVLLIIVGVFMLTGVWGVLMSTLGAVIGGFASPL